MADSKTSHFLVPSILDRLLGANPPSEQEVSRSRDRLVRELRRAIQRDLQDLLNTQWRCLDIPAGMVQLEKSLVRYGIPDLTGANVAAASQRVDFLKFIEESIRRFEPRLLRVEVLPLDDLQNPLERVFRFRIDAVLRTGSGLEEIEFVSTMEPSTGDFAVEQG